MYVGCSELGVFCLGFSQRDFFPSVGFFLCFFPLEDVGVILLNCLCVPPALLVCSSTLLSVVVVLSVFDDFYLALHSGRLITIVCLSLSQFVACKGCCMLGT